MADDVLAGVALAAMLIGAVAIGRAAIGAAVAELPPIAPPTAREAATYAVGFAIGDGRIDRRYRGLAARAAFEAAFDLRDATGRDVFVVEESAHPGGFCGVVPGVRT